MADVTGDREVVHPASIELWFDPRKIRWDGDVVARCGQWFAWADNPRPGGPGGLGRLDHGDTIEEAIGKVVARHPDWFEGAVVWPDLPAGVDVSAIAVANVIEAGNRRALEASAPVEIVPSGVAAMFDAPLPTPCDRRHCEPLSDDEAWRAMLEAQRGTRNGSEVVGKLRTAGIVLARVAALAVLVVWLSACSRACGSVEPAKLGIAGQPTGETFIGDTGATITTYTVLYVTRAPRQPLDQSMRALPRLMHDGAADWRLVAVQAEDGTWLSESITFRNEATGLTRTVPVPQGGTCEVEGRE